MTGRSFKERLYEHNTDMKNKPKQNGKQNGNKNGNNTTKLREHVWKLKDQNIDFTVKWRILDRAPTFNPITRKCRVCLKEKFYIMYDKSGSSLNKRREVFNTCIHKKPKLLENFKS